MAIADTINSIRTHLETDYEALENIGAELENVDKNIENIASVVNGIYDNLPKTTGEDTNLSLTTLKGKMNIIPKGNIEQEIREGYNLFQAKLQTTTANGITVTNNNNGTFTINGTNTSTSLTTFRLDQSTQNGTDNLQNYEDGTYTLDIGIQNENIQMTLMQVNTWQQFIATGMNVRLKSGAITGATGMFIYIAIKGSATINNVVIKPMFVKGSYTTSTIPSFEPYVGGTASPNPTYPQDIEVVTGTQEVKVENVNLFVCRTDIAIGQSGTRDGITWKRTGENTFLFNGTATANFTFIIDKPSHLLENLRKGDTYTLSGCPSGGSSSTYRLQIYHSNLTSTTIDTGEGKSFTANIQSESNVAILIYNGYTANNLEFNVQIEKGSTKTTFAPHQEQTQTISLGDIELCKIGNYQDYLYKSSDKWYKKEQIGKVVLNGSETITGNGENTDYGQFVVTNNEKAIGKDNLISNKFVTQTGTTGNNIWGRDNNTNIYITIAKSICAYNIATFKTWLSTNTPIVYYVLATPNDIEITNETLISQLNNLEKMYSYNGITNISSNGNLPIVLGVSALKGE